MSRYERYETRSLVYSRWHRFALGDVEPMIDLDGIEYCAERGCEKPLLLIETALDRGQASKATTVLERLAERASTMAICVLYRSSSGTPDSSCDCRKGLVNPDCDHGVDRFRVRRVWPPPRTKFVIMTPEAYIDWLRAIRLNHHASDHHWGVA